MQSQHPDVQLHIEACASHYSAQACQSLSQPPISALRQKTTIPKLSTDRPVTSTDVQRGECQESMIGETNLTYGLDVIINNAVPADGIGLPLT